MAIQTVAMRNALVDAYKGQHRPPADPSGYYGRVAGGAG